LLPVEDIIEALLDTRVQEGLRQCLKDSIADIVSQCVDAKIKPLQDSINELKLESSHARKVSKELEKENISLRKQIDDLEAYSRRDSVIIYGLKESSFADAASARLSSAPPNAGINLSPESCASTERAIVEFSNKTLNVPLLQTDISIAHRLVKNRNDAHPAPIVVKFTNHRARNAVYAARKTLAQNKSGVYINEHLIQRRATLYREARLLVKAKKLQGAWTSGGVVFIKLSNLPDSRPIRVDEICDLPRG
jgi:hypothetical protein